MEGGLPSTVREGGMRESRAKKGRDSNREQSGRWVKGKVFGWRWEGTHGWAGGGYQGWCQGMGDRWGTWGKWIGV